MIIINSILVLTIIHHLALFSIPQTIVNKLYGLITRFFWKSTLDRVIHWRKRSILQLLKGLGGLGLGNIGTFTEALLMQKAWRIQQHPQLLISRVFCAPQCHLRSWNLYWGRRGLIKAARTLRNHCALKVEDGIGILVARDKWVDGQVLVMKDDVLLFVVVRLRVAYLLSPTYKAWNSSKIHSLFFSNKCFQDFRYRTSHFFLY